MTTLTVKSNDDQTEFWQGVDLEEPFEGVCTTNTGVCMCLTVTRIGLTCNGVEKHFLERELTSLIILIGRNDIQKTQLISFNYLQDNFNLSDVIYFFLCRMTSPSCHAFLVSKCKMTCQRHHLTQRLTVYSFEQKCSIFKMT